MRSRQAFRVEGAAEWKSRGWEVMADPPHLPEGLRGRGKGSSPGWSLRSRGKSSPVCAPLGLDVGPSRSPHSSWSIGTPPRPPSASPSSQADWDPGQAQMTRTSRCHTRKREAWAVTVLRTLDSGMEEAGMGGLELPTQLPPPTPSKPGPILPEVLTDASKSKTAPRASLPPPRDSPSFQNLRQLSLGIEGGAAAETLPLRK